jgi:dTDP-4-dehydrorhamnose 3,5-epimerase
MFERLANPDLILVTPKRHGDARGFFAETFRENVYAEAGITGPFIQDNHAFSAEQNVLRGLHFQTDPSAQGKLVSCLRGEILDVVVDLRRGSPHFRTATQVKLSGATGQQLYVPPGFAHGYLTLTPDCHVQYKVTAYYDASAERGLAWDDPDLAIDWRLAGATPILSEKDKNHPMLRDLPNCFTYTHETGGRRD